MAEVNWFYSKGQERSGAITIGELRQLIASNDVGPDDLVWTAGMEQWAPAGSVAGLSFPGAVSGASADAATPGAAPVSQPPRATGPAPAAAPISYYNVAGGMPPRAAQTLTGHARPTGDVGDWPLDDERVRQFESAVKLRKRVTAGANLYRAMLLLVVIAAVIVLLAGVVAFATGGGGRAATAGGVAMLVIFGVCLALAALYYFAWKATARSRRWAPLTMFIIFLCAVALNLLTSILATSGPGGNPAAVAGGLLGMILPAIFAVVSWRSFAAIPKYLAHPAWCQELLIKANL